MCPKCRQNAPVVYRGVNAYCTACGAPRMPLSSNSINLAGSSSKVSGTFARSIGWIILTIGLMTGFGTLATCGAIVGFASAAPYILGLPIAALSVLLGWLLLRSGHQLKDEGAKTEKLAKNQAIFALANVRGGVLTPMDVAQSIGTTVEDADALLTSLAKEQPENVTLDIDDQGNVLYRFMTPQLQAAHLRGGAWAPGQGRGTAGGQGVRVDAAPGARIDADDAAYEAAAEEELAQDSQARRQRP